MSSNIIILTGDIQTGKTTLLQQFCQQHNHVAGILTPIVNGKRMFYDIAEQLFFEMEANDSEEKLAIGKYLFSAAAFAKANTILLNAEKKQPLNYLIIDEIGPLEVRQKQGLFHSLHTLLQLPLTCPLLVVIRKSLVNEAIQAFNLNNATVMDIAAMKEHFSIT